LSLRAASRQIGLDLNALHRLECGKTCDGANLVKVLKWSFTDAVPKHKPARSKL